MEGSHILYIIFFLSFVLLILYRNQVLRKNKVIFEKIKKIKEENRDGKFFICAGVEEPYEGLVQFYGQAFNTDVRPGMSIEVRGVNYRIKEVYADDSSPSEPDPKAAAESDIAIVVGSISNSTYTSVRKRIKKDVAVPFKLR